MITHQGVGSNTEEYKIFENELHSTLRHANKGVGLRPWEYWAVQKNAEFKSSDSVLEFGSAWGYGCVMVAKCVHKLIVSDSYDWIKNRKDFNESRKKDWIDKVEAYNLANVTVQEIDIQATNFEDKSFDKIISYGSFEHVVDDAKGLREMFRILKDDGLVSMTIDFKYGDPNPYDEKARGRCYNKESITELVDKSPLRFLENPFSGWWDKGKDAADVNSVFALAVVLVKR